MTTTKAYVIDPAKREIIVTQIRGYGSIDGMLKDFANTIVLPNGRDILYAADSGLHKPDNKLFVASFYRSPIAGKAVIAGFENGYDAGRFVDVTLSLREIKSMITWPRYGIDDLRFSFGKVA